MKNDDIKCSQVQNSERLLVDASEEINKRLLARETFAIMKNTPRAQLYSHDSLRGPNE